MKKIDYNWVILLSFFISFPTTVYPVRKKAPPLGGMKNKERGPLGKIFLMGQVWGLMFLLELSNGVYAGEYLTKAEALKIAFPAAERIERKIVFISDKERQKIKVLSGVSGVENISRTFIYYEAIKEDKPAGYAVIKDVRGKLSWITFMVVVDLEGRIKHVEILNYRELKGAEIRDRKFLRQYEGKTARSPLRLNFDIDGVSGATISSRALNSGVKEILVCLFLLVIKK